MNRDYWWRRREGVEPSGDLTAPRLVLKTSGTTGHLPSPYINSDVCVLISGPRNVVSTMSGYHFNGGSGSECRSDIPSLKIDITLVHLHRCMPSCFHGDINRDTLARPLGQRSVPIVVKDERFHSGLFPRSFHSSTYHVAGYLSPIIPRE